LLFLHTVIDRSGISRAENELRGDSIDKRISRSHSIVREEITSVVIFRISLNSNECPGAAFDSDYTTKLDQIRL